MFPLHEHEIWFFKFDKFDPIGLKMIKFNDNDVKRNYDDK